MYLGAGCMFNTTHGADAHLGGRGLPAAVLFSRSGLHRRRVTSRQHRRRPRSGFTLPDVLISVLIIGILAAVAGPKYAKTVKLLRAESAAKRIKVDLGLARQNAISSSAAQTVQFTPSTDSYTLPGMADLNHSSQTYSVDLAAVPYDVVLVSATLGADTDIQFDQYGQPDSGGTITVQSGNFLQTVTVDPDTGRARIP